MIFGLSGLGRAELTRLLRNLRAICNKDDEEALKHLDVELTQIQKLLNEAQEEEKNIEQSERERRDVRDYLENLDSELARAELTLTNDFGRHTFYPTWASDFERDASNLGTDWSESTKAKYKNKTDAIRIRAFEFAKAYRQRTMEKTRRQLAELEELLDGEVPTNSWDLPDAGEFVRQMDTSWDETLKKLHPEEYQQLRTRASNIVDQVAGAYYLRTISEVLESPAISTAKQKIQLKKLRSAQAHLLRIGKMDEATKEQVSSAMRVLAWARARKMLDDAEVAEAGDNDKKGAKLRAQAKAVLKQDWAMVFGQTVPLNIEELSEFKQPIQS